MNRLGQALIMMLFGFAVLRVSLTDIYLRYVKEGLRPVLIITGVLLVVTAVTTLWYDRRAAPAGDAHDHHHESRTNWLLLLPVLCVILISPPALGSYAASQQGTVLSSRTAGATFRALPPGGDPLPLSVLNYASRAVLDDGRTLTGRTLRLTGFVTPGPDGRPMLARMVMSCCAADGRPIKVGLDGDVPAGVTEDTWLQVDGTYSTRRGTDPINRAEVPYLTVTAWQEIPAPTRQYE